MPERTGPWSDWHLGRVADTGGPVGWQVAGPGEIRPVWVAEPADRWLADGTRAIGWLAPWASSDWSAGGWHPSSAGGWHPSSAPEPAPGPRAICGWHPDARHRPRAIGGWHPAPGTAPERLVAGTRPPAPGRHPAPGTALERLVAGTWLPAPGPRHSAPERFGTRSHSAGRGISGDRGRRRRRGRSCCRGRRSGAWGRGGGRLWLRSRAQRG
jgi:hypothetical protein